MNTGARGSSHASMLDTYREVVTPEGVALHLPAAGPVPRALAWAIDLSIRMVLLMVASMVLAMLGTAGFGPYAVLMFLVFWFYPVLFEVLDHGRTPGKRALGLRGLAALTRNLMRTVDMLPFGYATGLLASLADPWGRRLGDMVAGTLVVHDARPHEPQAAPVSAALAPAVVLLPHEQAALVAFGERGPQLTQERQAELADLAEPLVQARGSLAVARLYGIAEDRTKTGRFRVEPDHPPGERQEIFVHRHQAEWTAFEQWLDVRGGNARKARAHRREWHGLRDHEMPERYRRLCQQLAAAGVAADVYHPAVDGGEVRARHGLIDREHHALHRREREVQAGTRPCTGSPGKERCRRTRRFSSCCSRARSS